MKTASFILVLISCLIFNSAQAQTKPNAAPEGPSLKASVDWLNKNFGTVSSGPWTYIQKWNYDPADPCKISFSRVETKEGVSTTFRWDFSMKDVDQYSPFYDVSGTRVEIMILSKNKARVIQRFKNDQVDKYDNQMLMFAPDVETGRKILEALKHTAALCNAAGGTDWYNSK
jgi:hypothetical protein